MSELSPDKLHIMFVEGTPVDRLVLPRVYTLTHSDISGDLFLTIGPEIIKKQISGWFTRVMRDEVWAEWIDDGDGLELLVHCHVSGGFALGSASWRYAIFRQHMPLVLEAFRYGDGVLFRQQAQLDEVGIKVRFHAATKSYNRVEEWCQFKDYRL